MAKRPIRKRSDIPSPNRIVEEIHSKGKTRIQAITPGGRPRTYTLILKKEKK
jgi:hypothetical protein